MMKHSIYASVSYLMLLTACQNQEAADQETANKKTDTLKTENRKSTNTEDNQVRSEAPDASNKIEQGYALPKFDDGMAQSPINILSSKIEKEIGHGDVIKLSGEIIAVENLGHTVQLDFSEGSTTIVNGKAHIFKQLHFHTPSEHLVDGMTFPMEMHMVNISKEKSENQPSHTVIGIFFKMGRENRFIKEFLNSIPQEENKKDSLRAGSVKLKDLFAGILQDELRKFYHYKGSLTTPPFTESVDWMISKYVFEASPEQIAAIEKIEGNNARHIQALHERKVRTN
ncbi:MAG TPA: carbonic anhydrase family protein [Chitinophagaceae bacterium]